MSPREFCAALRARGVTLAVTKAGKLKLPRAALTAADRAYLATNAAAVARAVSALAALAETRRRNAEQSEREQRQRVEECERRAQRERERRHVEWLATLDERRLCALVDAGKLTAGDVLLWREARDTVLRGVAMHATPMHVAEMLGDLVRRSE